MKEDVILAVKDLSVIYQTDLETVYAVNGVSFTLGRGESLGLVGETGAGKTTLALSIMQLLPERTGKVTGGEIWFEGEELTSLSEQKMRTIRGNKVAMIFQDPMSSLNPTFTIGYQIMEGLRIHLGLKKREAWVRAVELLARVGMKEPELVMKSYPHTLSGGMRQRAIIAMALACNPKLLIADEPTTALDVSVQAQILNLLKSLQNELQLTLLFIGHGLGAVHYVSDRIAVMQNGRIVELGDAREVFHHPQQEYTKMLLNSILEPKAYSEDRDS